MPQGKEAPRVTGGVVVETRNRIEVCSSHRSYPVLGPQGLPSPKPRGTPDPVTDARHRDRVVTEYPSNS